MIELLVFLVIVFGVFGLFLTQYLVQYRQAYALWIQDITYNGKNLEDDRKCEIGASIESLSRELCELSDVLFFVTLLINFTLFVIVSGITVKLYLYGFFHHVFYSSFFDYWNALNYATKADYILMLSGLLLSASIMCIIPKLLYSLKILGEEKQNAIDAKLFDVWWKHKCHRYKSPEYRENGQPSQLYRILAKRIANQDVTDATKDEIELVKNLYPKMFKNYC